MSSIHAALLLVLGFAAFSSAQQVPQCTCAQVEPCKNSYVNVILPCADSCQKYATAMGANYAQLRQCMLQKEPNLMQTYSCAQGMLKNICAARPGAMTQKRYPETMQLAAMSEINRMIQRSGAGAQLKPLLAQGKKFYGCMRSCMERKTGACHKKLGCSLALPPDNVIVQNTKQCAIQSGFGTEGVRQLCQCAVGAGIKQLAGVCGKIVVS